MDKQLIISIGRECGSGGHEIAKALAKELQLPLYDKEMLEKYCREKGYDVDSFYRYDEAPRNIFTSRRVRGFSNSPEENVAVMQFEILHEKAMQGDSFVVLGRCSEEILRDNPAMISIFVLADIGFKKQHLQTVHHVPAEEVLTAMVDTDRRRKYYHNQYSRGKWGDSRNYDLCVNSAALGLEGTIDFLKDYIRRRQEQM